MNLSIFNVDYSVVGMYIRSKDKLSVRFVIQLVLSCKLPYKGSVRGRLFCIAKLGDSCI